MVNNLLTNLPMLRNALILLLTTKVLCGIIIYHPQMASMKLMFTWFVPIPNSKFILKESSFLTCQISYIISSILKYDMRESLANYEQRQYECRKENETSECGNSIAIDSGSYNLLNWTSHEYSWHSVRRRFS